jgi:uncharacterized protein YbjT (DUF2867 family)
MKTALVIGATGMVGRQLVQQLLQDSRFSKVIVFVRRTTGISQARLEEHLIDFDAPESWQHLVNGDVLFSALGTTIKQACSQAAQYKIDYTYQYNFAKAAALNGVSTYVLISSAGANAASPIFYSRMKGELEEAVKLLSIPFIHIIQPRLLTGDRKEFRLGEKLATPILSAVTLLPVIRKYRPIHARTVAKAMINAAFDQSNPISIHTLEGVFSLAKR